MARKMPGSRLGSVEPGTAVEDGTAVPSSRDVRMDKNLVLSVAYTVSTEIRFMQLWPRTQGPSTHGRQGRISAGVISECLSRSTGPNSRSLEGPNNTMDGIPQACATCAGPVSAATNRSQ